MTFIKIIYLHLEIIVINCNKLNINLQQIEIDDLD